MDYRVDWVSYSDAVREHARRETGNFSNLAVPDAVRAIDNRMSEPGLREDDSKYFFRRAQGIALVILALGVAIALLIWANHRAFANSTANSAPRITASDPILTSLGKNNFSPQPTTPDQQDRTPSKTPEALNFIRFVERKLDDLIIVSGWIYGNSRERRPAKQYCYVDLNDPNGGARRTQVIANDSRPIPYNAKTMTPVTRDQYKNALLECRWHTL